MKPGKQMPVQPVLPAGPFTTAAFEPSGDYAAMRIPALVLQHKKVRCWFFVKRRIGNASDTTDMDIRMRRSTDGGKNGTVVSIAGRQTCAIQSLVNPLLTGMVQFT